MNKGTKKLVVILSVISLLTGIITGFTRIQEEKKRKDIQVAIRYSDALMISKLNDEPLEDVLKRFKDAGVNALFVRENTLMPEGSMDLLNFKAQGKATYYEGYDLINLYPKEDIIQPQNIYIEVLDKKIEDDIYNSIYYKNINADKITIEDRDFISIQEFSGTLSTLGLGFNQDDLKQAADLGYTILPQIKSWINPTEEGVSYITQQIQQIPNLGTVFFADTEVIGADSEDMIELVGNKGLGFVEFFSDKQEEFRILAKKSKLEEQAYNVIRLHTVTDSEVNLYDKQGLMERYMLALRERGNNIFLFKMPTKDDISENEAKIIENIEEFVLQASKHDYLLSDEIQGHNLPSLNFWGVLFIAISAFGVFILLCDQLNLAKSGIILSVIGFLGYAVILKLNFLLATQLIALFGTVCFPTYATTKGVEATVEGSKGMKGAIEALITTTCISLAGAIFIIGTISQSGFSLGIDLFRGVKIAFVLPIIMTLVIVKVRHSDSIVSELKDLIKKPISYGRLMVIGALILIMLVYLMKSGNSGVKIEVEIKLRQMLYNLLGVRPRTKEFLIGYPIIMVVGYYGYKKLYWLLVVLATVGPISVMNSFTHVHTPLMISIIRTIYGVIGGIVVGVILIYIIEFIRHFVNRKLLKV